MSGAEPVPVAYRDLLSLTSGLTLTWCERPIEAAVLERMLRGGFLSGGLLSDVLLIALIDTGVAVWALDGESVDGPLGIRASREGERLGRSWLARAGAGGRSAGRGRRLLGPVAVLFGRARRGARAASRDSRRLDAVLPSRSPACRRCTWRRPCGIAARRSNSPDGLGVPADALGADRRGFQVGHRRRQPPALVESALPALGGEVGPDPVRAAYRRSPCAPPTASAPQGSSLRAQVARLERECSAIVAEGVSAPPREPSPATGAGARGSSVGRRACLTRSGQLERSRDRARGSGAGVSRVCAAERAEQRAARQPVASGR